MGRRAHGQGVHVLCPPPLPPHGPRPRGSCAPGSGQRGSRRRAAATECELRRAGSARRASRTRKLLRRPRAPVHRNFSIIPTVLLCRPRCCCCCCCTLCPFRAFRLPSGQDILLRGTLLRTRSARTSHYPSSRSGEPPSGSAGRAPAPRGVIVKTRRGARRRCVAQRHAAFPGLL